MDLFDYMRETAPDDSPLAKRMRPVTLDDVVGQEHIIGKDKLLYRAIKADKISSLIFYGPPGTGKTTLAMVIANTTKAEFRQLNATTAGKKDMELVVNEAKDMNVWHDYVAGTDPTDVNDVFQAIIEFADGLPNVNWRPNLNDNGEVRTYKVYGRRSLSNFDAWEYPANSAEHQFFKVDVSMPGTGDGGSDAA